MTDVTVKEVWKFQKLKKFFDILNLLAGCPTYTPTTSNKYWKAHAKLQLGNYIIITCFAWYFAFQWKNQTLLIIVSRCKINFKYLQVFVFSLKTKQKQSVQSFDNFTRQKVCQKSWSMYKFHA